MTRRTAERRRRWRVRLTCTAACRHSASGGRRPGDAGKHPVGSVPEVADGRRAQVASLSKARSTRRVLHESGEPRARRTPAPATSCGRRRGRVRARSWRVRDAVRGPTALVASVWRPPRAGTAPRRARRTGRWCLTPVTVRRRYGRAQSQPPPRRPVRARPVAGGRASSKRSVGGRLRCRLSRYGGRRRQPSNQWSPSVYGRPGCPPRRTARRRRSRSRVRDAVVARSAARRRVGHHGLRCLRVAKRPGSDDWPSAPYRLPVVLDALHGG
ncbi:hypothetical protein STENM36S_02308 [Streptomyces tendae]